MERMVGILKGRNKSRYQANRSLALVSYQMELLSHVTYICSDPQVQYQGHSRPDIGFLTPPGPADVLLPRREYTRLLTFLSWHYQSSEFHLRRALPTLSEFKLRKFYRYQTEIHAIGCQEKREVSMQSTGRANFYIRYTHASGQDYGAVQYFAKMDTSDGILPPAAENDDDSNEVHVAFIHIFAVVEDNQLTMLTDLQRESAYIYCQDIDGLIGLLKKEGRYYIVDADTAFLFSSDQEE